jgi:hypothetical protein
MDEQNLTQLLLMYSLKNTKNKKKIETYIHRNKTHNDSQCDYLGVAKKKYVDLCNEVYKMKKGLSRLKNGTTFGVFVIGCPSALMENGVDKNLAQMIKMRTTLVCGELLGVIDIDSLYNVGNDIMAKNDGECSYSDIFQAIDESTKKALYIA